jgi:F0F1-type ATP synthase assembly protein I
MGLELAITVLVVAAVGHWLDRLWGTEPWLLVLGAALGMTVAMVNLVRKARPGGKEKV